MQNKRGTWALLLVIGLLYRARLLDVQVWQQESINWTAILVTFIGGIIVLTTGYALVIALQLREVGQIASIIFFGGVLCKLLGNRLADLPMFDDFWGGFVEGGMEIMLLWGTLYGAKEVWSAKPDERQKPDAPQQPEESDTSDEPDESQP